MPGDDDGDRDPGGGRWRCRRPSPSASARSPRAAAAAGRAAGDLDGGLTGAPIVLGLINQEDAPVGSFPDLRRGAEAAVPT